MEKMKGILLVRTRLSDSQVQYLSKNLNDYLDIVFCFKKELDLDERLRKRVKVVIAHSLCPEEASQYPELRFVHIYGRGTEMICIEWLKQQRIRYMRCSNEYLIDSISEYLLGQILFWEQNIQTIMGQGKEGNWSWNSRSSYSFRLLNQLNIGIVGNGFLGKGVGLFFRHLGANCTFINIGTRMTVKDIELLHEIDYLSIHLQYNASTAGIIGKETLQHLSPHAVLLNTSRGGVVNEFDLVQAINDHTIRGATLDVTAKEPLAEDHPFKQCEKIVITPHIAGRALPALEGNITEIVENIRNELFK